MLYLLLLVAGWNLSLLTRGSTLLSYCDTFYSFHQRGVTPWGSLADIEKHNFVLTPERYVGIPDEVDDGIEFEDKMRVLTSDLAAQLKEAEVLDLEIKLQLAKVGFSLKEFL